MGDIRGNSLYTVVNGPTWTDAENRSIDLGGHLAIITSEEENTFLVDKLTTALAGQYAPIPNQSYGWIGVARTNGTFYYSDGSDLTYSRWAPGQPDAAGTTNDYVILNLVDSDPNSGFTTRWDDVTIDRYGTGAKGIAEIPLTISIELPGSPTEGAGEFTVNIDLTAGATEYKYSLVEGAQVWYVVSGITQEDLEDEYSLTGRGTIDENGNIVLDGAATAGIKFALKDDGIEETEDFKITFYTDDPATTTEFLTDVQLGSMESAAIVDTGIPFTVGAASSDDANVVISGLSGSGNTSQIEVVTITRINTNTGKGKPVWEETPAYTTLEQFDGVDGITYSGGASANTITAAGISGDPLRPAFNGQTILDGQLGTDFITGGSYRNWLVGGGIYSTPLSTTTTSVDTLIGTVGALDVFDLRTSDFSADAYSATNSGSARINNYSTSQDWIVLAGAQGTYTITPQTTKSGKGKNATSTTTYQIFSGTELVATVSAASGSTFTGTASSDLQILYGQQGDPTETLFNGQQVFFG